MRRTYITVLLLKILLATSLEIVADNGTVPSVQNDVVVQCREALQDIEHVSEQEGRACVLKLSTLLPQIAREPRKEYVTLYGDVLSCTNVPVSCRVTALRALFQVTNDEKVLERYLDGQVEDQLRAEAIRILAPLRVGNKEFDSMVEDLIKNRRKYPGSAVRAVSYELQAIRDFCKRRGELQDEASRRSFLVEYVGNVFEGPAPAGCRLAVSEGAFAQYLLREFVSAYRRDAEGLRDAIVTRYTPGNDAEDTAVAALLELLNKSGQ